MKNHQRIILDQYGSIQTRSQAFPRMPTTRYYLLSLSLSTFLCVCDCALCTRPCRALNTLPNSVKKLVGSRKAQVGACGLPAEVVRLEKRQKRRGTGRAPAWLAHAVFHHGFIGIRGRGMTFVPLITETKVHQLSPTTKSNANWRNANDNVAPMWCNDCCHLYNSSAYSPSCVSTSY